MAEEKKKVLRQNNVGCMCQGVMGMCECGGRGAGILRLIRWIFGIIILAMVFSFGVKIGELKGALEYEYGYHMMQPQPYGMYGAYPMMQGALSSTAPAAK